MSEQDPAPTLEKAVMDALIEAVREAGKMEIMPRFRRLSESDISTKQGPDDLVTVADKEAEALITQRVKDIMPTAHIVGEEAVAENPVLLNDIDSSEWCVIIDPIDGTSNFAHGIAVFGVILAVTYKGQTVFGLLYDPVMDDWVMAVRGAGAFFCTPTSAPKPLMPVGTVAVGEAHGYVALWLFEKHQQVAIINNFPRFARISCLRCSCHEYRQMALGNAHFVVSATPKPWDHAAGVLIMRELGGRGSVDTLDDYRAGAINERSLVAGVANLHDDVRELVFTTHARESGQG